MVIQIFTISICNSQSFHRRTWWNHTNIMIVIKSNTFVLFTVTVWILTNRHVHNTKEILFYVSLGSSRVESFIYRFPSHRVTLFSYQHFCLWSTDISSGIQNPVFHQWLRSLFQISRDLDMKGHAHGYKYNTYYRILMFWDHHVKHLNQVILTSFFPFFPN